jgi:hypothetical protein
MTYRAMLATLVDEPFDDKSWVFETQMGWLPLLKRWQEQIDGSCVIDGELCALDAIDVTTRYAVRMGAHCHERTKRA